MDTLLNLLPYVAMIGAFVLSLLELIAEGNKPWKKTKLFIYFVLAAIGVVSLNYDRGEKAKEQAEQKGQVIAGLARIDKLQDTLTRMETSNATKSLEKELTTVRLQLLNTQKAMAPGPKAKLAFTLVPYEKPMLGAILKPVTRIKRIVGDDLRVKFTISGMNITHVNAADLKTLIRICAGCKFFSEPRGFLKAVGSEETDRYASGYAAAMSLLEDMDFEIIVPPNTPVISIGMGYRCNNCDLEIKLQYLYIEMLNSMVPSQEPPSLLPSISSATN